MKPEEVIPFVKTLKPIPEHLIAGKELNSKKILMRLVAQALLQHMQGGDLLPWLLKNPDQCDLDNLSKDDINPFMAISFYADIGIETDSSKFVEIIKYLYYLYQEVNKHSQPSENGDFETWDEDRFNEAQALMCLEWVD